MEKVIIRTGHRSNGQIQLQTLMDAHSCDTAQKLADKLGYDEILKLIYQDELSYNALKEEYEQFLGQGESSHFAWGYLLSPTHALCIDSHIRFCILDSTPPLFPWRYINRSVYLADTWWFDDQEIVKDATSLTLVGFLKKYAGGKDE